MKHLITSVILMALTLNSFAINFSSDERLELISIICSMSGFKEYSNNQQCPDYYADVYEYFEPVKNHPITDKMRQLRSSHGIGYDAPMSLAVNIKKDNDNFKLTTNKSVLEKRWQNVDMDTVMFLINDFYKVSGFKKFYDSHRDFYKKYCSEYDRIISANFNESWYSDFYGNPPEEKFSIYLCFMNGGQCYGPNTLSENGHLMPNSIIGLVLDKNGGLYFENKPGILLSIIVHEFNHSFVNPLADQNTEYYKDLETAGQKLFNLESAVMQITAYKNWETIVNESLVRAAVLNYLIDNNCTKEELQNAISLDLQQGFVWVPILAVKLKEYKTQRDKYHCLKDFYPEIIKFYNDYTSPATDAIHNLLNQAS